MTTITSITHNHNHTHFQRHYWFSSNLHSAVHSLRTHLEIWLTRKLVLFFDRMRVIKIHTIKVA